MVRLIRLLSRLKPDVLHCWLYHSCLIGYIASRFVRPANLIWALRSANPGFPTYSMRTRAVIRMCARLSSVPDVITLNSEKGRAVHEEWGYCTKTMHVIANGTDVNRFLPDPHARTSVREELGISQDSVVIGLIARFHPLKDHETFLRAAASLCRQHPNLHFLFAGQDMAPGNDALLRLIRENGVQHA